MQSCWLTLNSHIVVVVRLRVIVILNHGETTAHVVDLGGLGGCSAHSGDWATVRQVSMDRKVGVVLELKLLGVWVREVA